MNIIKLLDKIAINIYEKIKEEIPNKLNKVRFNLMKEDFGYKSYDMKSKKKKKKIFC